MVCGEVGSQFEVAVDTRGPPPGRQGPRLDTKSEARGAILIRPMVREKWSPKSI